MMILDERIVWSASDLTGAAECEYGLLRDLDVRLGRARRPEQASDPLMDRIAAMGDTHEARILEALVGDGSSEVRQIERATDHSTVALRALHEETVQALKGSADLVYQAGFFDGEFHGYADFLVRTDQGWQVCDAKLARSARPKALLQLAAYADQLRRANLPVAPTAVLMLGNGTREAFPLMDIEPVFRERRRRLRLLLTTHLSVNEPVAWGQDGLSVCGSCAHCTAVIEETQDVLLVARLRRDQRMTLWKSGIRSVADLATAARAPDGMRTSTFETLRAQAALQWEQMQDAPENRRVRYELLPEAGTTLAALPAPSPGDLFFDFEGDPLHHDETLTHFGLEYLWGFLGARAASPSHDPFTALWAFTPEEEKAALVAFLEGVASLRAQYPGMHVYHYAPYETTALKRLVVVHSTHEDALDQMLRDGVFVDLYATVRGSVRVSQPSYSIKKLEPLHMGAELRTGDVTAGDQSIEWFHLMRDAIDRGDTEEADRLRSDLRDYNRYDCVSTLRLRDWLLTLRREASPGESSPVVPARTSVTVDSTTQAGDTAAVEGDPLIDELLARASRDAGRSRTADEQTYAMLAASLGYYQREARPFWWEHFDRLAHPLDEWRDQKDVFEVTRAEVLEPWATTGRQKRPRRTLRLSGHWGPGSTPGTTGLLAYGEPAPTSSRSIELGLFAYGSLDHLTVDAEGMTVVETTDPDNTHDHLPDVVTPAPPPHAGNITAFLRRLAGGLLAQDLLPTSPATDILRRRPSRLVGGASLVRTGDDLYDITSSLLGMTDSYVAVQGPPGTGKTYTGARVIAELVQKHGWTVGVVASSHAVVENLLQEVVAAGVAAERVGKSRHQRPDAAFSDVKDTSRSRAAFVSTHRAVGSVLGGTAWTFSSQDLLDVGGFDLLVIDEAGQFALAPTLAVSLVAQRLLLLGDPQQLPQVSQGTHPEPVDKSALGWLLGEHETVPTTHGYFLETSRRMHPSVCAGVSRLSYEGRLHAHPHTRERRMTRVEPGIRVLPIEHRDNRTASVEEARAIRDEIQHLFSEARWSASQDATPRPLAAADVLVVAPYNAQVNLIRSTLAATGNGLEEVRVGTVDKFQGQEAPVVLVSMTASSSEDVPRGMRFLLNRNRINVAVSRAQWLAVVVRSPALTTYMPVSTSELLDLGAFVGLCEGAPTDPSSRHHPSESGVLTT